MEPFDIILLIFTLVTLAFAGVALFNTFRCTKRIQGVFTGVQRYGSKYAPVFKYVYDGETIEGRTYQLYSPSQLQSKYTEGETYEIFVDPRDPRICAGERRIVSTVWVYLAFGIICFIMLFV